MIQGAASVGHPVDVASGAVYTSKEDFRIPGSFPLVWLRKFHSGLLKTPDPVLGAGWASPYGATLTRLDREYQFVTPDGAREVFTDSEGDIERGKAVRNPGTFRELAKIGPRLVVTNWTPGTHRVTRYVFHPGPVGTAQPLVAVEDPAGRALDLAWDRGRLSRVRQRLEQRTLVVEHDAAGRAATVALLLPQGGTKTIVRYEYDDRGRLAAAFDALGHADRYEYDSAGRLVREIARDGGVFSFRYDDTGRCIRTTGLDNYNFKSIRYYDNMGLTEVTDSHGRIARYRWNPRGQVELSIDPLGAQTRTEFDEFGRIAKRVDPMGGEVSFGYDVEGNRNLVTNQVGAVTEFKFNAARLPIELLDASGGKWTRAYDAANRIVESMDPLGNAWLYAYENRGLLAEIKAPTGESKRFTWDAGGNLAVSTDWEGNAYRHAYDAFGRVVAIKSPSGKTTRNSYDDLGNLVRVDLQDGTHEAYAYDAGGNMVYRRMRDGRAMKWKYGSCRRLLEEQEPDGAVRRFHWGTEPAWLDKIENSKGQAYRFLRDAVGRPIRETGFDGREIVFEYNLAGFPTVEVRPGGGKIEAVRDALGRITKQILPDGEAARFGYDPLGRIALAANSDSEVKFVRDAAGRVVEEVRDGVAVKAAFDARGNRIGLRWGESGEFDYTYDGNGLLTSIASPALGRIEFGRDALGKETTRTFPDGRVFSQERDDSGRVLEQRLRAAGPGNTATLWQRTYAYGLSGDLVSSSGPGTGRTAYEYDAGSRLAKVADSDGRVESFAYDADGNWSGYASADARVSATFGPGDRLTRFGAAEYAFDEGGRVVTKRIHFDDGSLREWSFTWDALDRMIGVRAPDSREWRYRYDALGRRIGKQGPDGKEEFFWDGDVLLAHRREGRETLWQFSRTDFTPIFSLEGRKFAAALTDHNGTPRHVLSGGGGPLQALHLGPWGDSRPGGADDGSYPVRFQGQWHDPETGLHYNRYRYYDPACGRYLSQDPIRLQGGLNLYSYARNPVNHVDPFGLCEESELDWSRTNAKGETAEEHVRLHEQNNVRKQDHGVFYGDAVDTVNAAWANRGDIQPIQVPGGNGNDVYVIPHPNAGYAGGRSGQGQNLDNVTIVTLPGTNTVVTGFPSGSGVSQGPYYQGSS